MVHFRVLNLSLAALFLLACQFFGQLSFAQEQGKCEAAILQTRSYAYQELSLDPFSAHNLLAQRHKAQKLKNPKRPYGFSTEGVMDSQVHKMKANLIERFEVLSRQNIKEHLLKFVQKTIDLSTKTINNSYLYEDVLVLGLWHSMVMSIDSKFESLFLDNDISRQTSMRNPFKENFERSHPRFGYYLPVMGVSEKLDLVRTRSALLYAIGITTNSEFADGSPMTPYQFFIHDWSAHAGRSASADAAFILYLDPSQLPEFYGTRMKVMQFINKIFEDSQYSKHLKDKYEDLLYRMDHEDSGLISIDHLYLRTLLTYFIDQPKSTMPKVIPLHFQEPNPDWMRIQGHQLLDFQRLFRASSEFREFWEGFKKRFKRNPRISEVIQTYEDSLEP